MSRTPTLVFVPGSWHKPKCYEKVIKPLENEHNIRCVAVTLPSTTNNPNATFKDDIDAARNAITAETAQGRDVIVITHSYGGLVGNSSIKGLTAPKGSSTTSTGQGSAHAQSQNATSGYVKAIVMIATGHNMTGLAFMDPFFGIPPPFFRVDKETGYAVLVANPREFFYHDLPDEEANYWVSELTTQSLKSLFEGGENGYAGWQDVPNWYIGTVEDVGLPVAVQRMSVSMARGQGAVVHHTELKSSHSPFLSMPDDVVDVLLEAVRTVSGTQGEVELTSEQSERKRRRDYEAPVVRLAAPITWFKFGLPVIFGRLMGWGFIGVMSLRRLWRRK